MAKIIAPNEGFTGKRGNVAFVDGKAETDDPSMVSYFRRHGYKVEDDKPTRGRAASATKSED